LAASSSVSRISPATTLIVGSNLGGCLSKRLNIQRPFFAAAPFRGGGEFVKPDITLVEAHGL
jgi:hypothetical protein